MPWTLNPEPRTPHPGPRTPGAFDDIFHGPSASAASGSSRPRCPAGQQAAATAPPLATPGSCSHSHLGSAGVALSAGDTSMGMGSGTWGRPAIRRQRSQLGALLDETSKPQPLTGLTPEP